MVLLLISSKMETESRSTIVYNAAERPKKMYSYANGL